MRIAVGGSAANPPHHGHRALIQQLLECNLFDIVIWIPSGERFDKRIDITPDDRIAMTELFIPKMWRVRTNPKLIIKYDEVYGKESFSSERVGRLFEEYEDHQPEIYWYTGSDTNVEEWHEGTWLIQHKAVVYIPRRGYPIPDNGAFQDAFDELPNINSSTIREMVENGDNINHLVDPHVAEYIRRNKLYV